MLRLSKHGWMSKVCETREALTHNRLSHYLKSWALPSRQGQGQPAFQKQKQFWGYNNCMDSWYMKYCNNVFSKCIKPKYTATKWTTCNHFITLLSIVAILWQFLLDGGDAVCLNFPCINWPWTRSIFPVSASCGPASAVIAPSRPLLYSVIQ